MLEPEIIYEDEDILAINKPAGLIVHPDGRTNESSVSEWFVSRYPGARAVGESINLGGGKVIERPGIVHRIDRETSGLLLMAKTAKGHAHLKQQFQNREVEKIYHAFVYGRVVDGVGTINLPIARSVKNFKKRSTSNLQRGEAREALTYYQVRARGGDGSYTFVEARPKTGRTHQLRVHFKAIHHPIICDSLYAPKSPSLLGFKRLALHAQGITFENLKGERVSLTAEYPQDFKEALSQAGFV